MAGLFILLLVGGTQQNFAAIELIYRCLTADDSPKTPLSLALNGRSYNFAVRALHSTSLDRRFV